MAGYIMNFRFFLIFLYKGKILAAENFAFMQGGQEY